MSIGLSYYPISLLSLTMFGDSYILIVKLVISNMLMMIQDIPPVSTDSGASLTGFTRIELIIVIFITMIFWTIGSAGILSFQQGNGSVKCMSNLSSLVMAWNMYSDDNNGYLLGSKHSLTGASDWAARDESWFMSPITAKLEDINPEILLKNSPMIPFLSQAQNDATAFKKFQCPSDPSRGSHPDYKGGVAQRRLRSYSMNNWVAGSPWGPQGNWTIYRKKDEIINPSPANLIILIGERADSINDTRFYIDMKGHPDFKNEGEFGYIVDLPSFYHQGGASVSFADGHVELKKWADPRTTPPYIPGKFIALNRPADGSTDHAWLVRRASQNIAR